MTRLPALAYEDWRATKDTLHLYAQVLGKVKLASVPPRNHWWHAALYVSERGITSGRMTHLGDPDAVSFALELDCVDHALVARTSRGEVRGVPLRDGPAPDPALDPLTLPEVLDRAPGG